MDEHINEHVDEHCEEPLTVNGYTIERVNCRKARITEPCGMVWDGIVFGQSCGDTLEEMLAWHCRGGRAVDEPVISDRERIAALVQRIEALEALLGAGAPQVTEPVTESVEEPVPIGEMEIPEEIEIPRFLAPDPLEDVPESLQDLAEPDETPEAMQARIWALWLQLNGKLMLGLATTEETALHSRLHNELHWFAPPIEGET
jgi:hypothetical protein